MHVYLFCFSLQKSIARVIRIWVFSRETDVIEMAPVSGGRRRTRAVVRRVPEAKSVAIVSRGLNALASCPDVNAFCTPSSFRSFIGGETRLLTTAAGAHHRRRPLGAVREAEWLPFAWITEHCDPRVVLWIRLQTQSKNVRIDMMENEQTLHTHSKIH